MIVLLAACLSVTVLPSVAHAGPALDRSEKKVIRLINKYRVANGRPRLRVNHKLNRAADRHSEEMVAHRYFAHGSANGTSAANRVRGFRRSARMGENIAFVDNSEKRPAAAVFALWLNSPGHRAVMLDRGFRRVGVARRWGTVGGKSGVAYTADFATAR